MLREIVAGSMTQLESVIREAERADSDARDFNPIGDFPASDPQGDMEHGNIYLNPVGDLDLNDW